MVDTAGDEDGKTRWVGLMGFRSCSEVEDRRPAELAVVGMHLDQDSRAVDKRDRLAASLHRQPAGDIDDYLENCCWVRGTEGTQDSASDNLHRMAVDQRVRACKDPLADAEGSRYVADKIHGDIVVVEDGHGERNQAAGRSSADSHHGRPGADSRRNLEGIAAIVPPLWTRQQEELRKGG